MRTSQDETSKGRHPVIADRVNDSCMNNMNIFFSKILSQRQNIL